MAVGEILWDLLPAGPRLGGTTANFAIGCARLGRAASLVSSLGADSWGDLAREVLRDMQQEGAEMLATSLIQTAQHAPTGLVNVTLGSDGQPRYVIAAPAAWDEIQVTSANLAEASGAQAICFGTLCQRSPTSRESIRALIQATDPNAVRLLDLNVRMPFFSKDVAHWSLAHATVAKISGEELGVVAAAAGLEPLAVNESDPSIAEIERCGWQILGLYPGLHLLAVTLGAQGSLLLTAAESHYHPGFAVDVVDTVGAGDAFTAGLLHAWLTGAPLEAVNEVGNLCGSFVASCPGATPPFPAPLVSKVDAVLSQHPRGPSYAP